MVRMPLHWLHGGALSGQDNQSISADPLFASASDLKPFTGSPLVGAGGQVPVIVDIIGLARSVTTPTIGAYEQAGDINGPLISYTALKNTQCSVDRILTPVTITDIGGVNINAGTRPRLYYKKLTNANTYIDNTSASNGWKYVEASGTVSPFSFTMLYAKIFGAVIEGDIIQYFVVAQDLAVVPNISINSGTFALTPTSVALTAAAFPVGGTIEQYRLQTGLDTDVTIGNGGTYPTITGAGGLFEAINNSGLSVNLNAFIISTSINEPGTVALNAVSYPCSGGPYTLTVKPAAGIGAVLTGSNSNGAIIKLNGADHITIDGLNSGGSSLSITNSSASLTSVVVWIASADAGDGATNNIIRNCTINGATNITTAVGILAGSGAIIGEPAEAANSDNIIQGNTIKTCQNAVYISGVNGTLDQNWSVINNMFGSVTVAEKMAYRGMFIGSVQNMNVNSNTIMGVASTSSTSSTMMP